MQNVIAPLMVIVLKAVNFIFKPFKTRKKVSIISRQSDAPTLDIQLLYEGLKRRGIETVALTKKIDYSFVGLIGYFLHMIRQMYHIATSKAVVLDGYCILISILPKRANQTVIQMWHAMGAIKKFGWQNVGERMGKSVNIADTMEMHKNYDYIVAPGKITGRLFSEAFNTDKEKIVYYGLPRTDYLMKNDRNIVNEVKKVYPSIEEKVNILYVPTFRKGIRIDMDDMIENFDFDRFNLIIKKHFLDDNDYSYARKAGAIVDEEFSSMIWMKICTKIITDYSAIAFEAGILDKDIYIYQPDEDEYMTDIGLNIDMRAEAIGRYVCKSGSRLIALLGEPYDKASVLAFKNKYIEVPLDDCTGRLCDFIEQQL